MLILSSNLKGKKYMKKLIVHADTFIDSAIKSYVEKKKRKKTGFLHSEDLDKENIIDCGHVFLCKSLQEIGLIGHNIQPTRRS